MNDKYTMPRDAEMKGDRGLRPKLSSKATRINLDGAKLKAIVMHKWWGYRHVNGSLRLKRYFDDPTTLLEASESDFVSQVVGPFEASDREAATTILKMLLSDRVKGES